MRWRGGCQGMMHGGSQSVDAGALVKGLILNRQIGRDHQLACCTDFSSRASSTRCARWRRNLKAGQHWAIALIDNDIGGRDVVMPQRWPLLLQGNEDVQQRVEIRDDIVFSQ